MRLMTAFCISALAGIAMGAAAMACNEPYPPSMVKAFMSNCNKDSKLTKFCDCVIDSVQKTIPLAEFIENGAHTDTGGINSDPRYASATQRCSKKFPFTGKQP